MYQDRKKTTRSLLYYWWQFRSSCCWSSERRKWTFDLVGIDLNLAVYVSTSWGWGSSKTKGLEARYTLWYFVDRVSFFSLKRTCSGCSIFRCFFFSGGHLPSPPQVHRRNFTTFRPSSCCSSLRNCRESCEGPQIGRISSNVCRKFSPENERLEPENHLFEKENHLPNLHYCVPCWFSRV